MSIKKHLMVPTKDKTLKSEHVNNNVIARLAPLYARGENGNILMTEYEVKGSSFRSITGLKDSPKRLVSGWVDCTATNVGRANERSADQQAYFEARARWHKKQDQEGYHLKESDIDNGAGFVEPMLAYPMAGRKLPKRIMLDRKYNGMRMIATGGKGYSRKGKPI